MKLPFEGAVEEAELEAQGIDPVFFQCLGV